MKADTNEGDTVHQEASDFSLVSCNYSLLQVKLIESSLYICCSAKPQSDNMRIASSQQTKRHLKNNATDGLDCTCHETFIKRGTSF
ncbi:hypothetical protein JOB18_032074 [Solea senegalensis]|uniref:Uncharacterized protein n=1 Tax=Solea senegalensis TaxID=28829 RepID=A0AAV6Q472_SOLSE|nr:hypothetical protein JOB18_032074 [Solea senegalensis]